RPRLRRLVIRRIDDRTGRGRGAILELLAVSPPFPHPKPLACFAPRAIRTHSHASRLRFSAIQNRAHHLTGEKDRPLFERRVFALLLRPRMRHGQDHPRLRPPKQLRAARKTGSAPRLSRRLIQARRRRPPSSANPHNPSIDNDAGSGAATASLTIRLSIRSKFSCRPSPLLEPLLVSKSPRNML